MKVRIVTALFDINRAQKGDGRTMRDYLLWFSKTLRVNYDMTIYTEPKYHSFVLANRPQQFATDIVLQNYNDVPYYKYYNDTASVLQSAHFRNNMTGLDRIECYFPDYIIIIHSKFPWLKKVTEDCDADYIVWMDAGYSRFFGQQDLYLNSELTNTSKLTENTDKLSIRSDVRSFECNIWGQHSHLSAGLFGGGRDVIRKLEEETIQLFVSNLQNNSVNNEQILLAVLAQQKPELFNPIVSSYFLSLHDILG